MRLLLNLKAQRTVVQNKENNSKFHTGMHGWIYGKLEKTEYGSLHSKNKFKPFCFGNIYPIQNRRIEEDKTYKLLISSPDEMFVISMLSNINSDELLDLCVFS